MTIHRIPATDADRIQTVRNSLMQNHDIIEVYSEDSMSAFGIEGVELVEYTIMKVDRYSYIYTTYNGDAGCSSVVVTTQ